MIQLYRFHMKNGTQKEATGNTDIEAANKIDLKIKDYESYEILPGKSLTAEQVEEVKEDAIVSTTDAIVTPSKDATGNTPIKPLRKPRADKGQPRGKSPDKPKRNRGKYFVLTDNGQKMAFNQYPSREALTHFLSDLSPGTEAKVVQGHEIKFEKHVQFTLKPAK